MKHFEMEVPYIKSSNDIVQDMMCNIMRNATPDLNAILRAGCKMETIIDNRQIVIIRTYFPISILKDQHGNIIDIIEKKQ